MAAVVKMESSKAFSELQDKVICQVIETQQKVKLIGKQIEQLNITKSCVYLTDIQIMALEDDTNMYEGVRRMFVHQSKAVIHNQLQEKLKIMDEKIKELEQKKAYLEQSIKEAEDNIREMLMAQSSHSALSLYCRN
ncbi:PREDICTED: prefoldin subunit 1-like [Chrysochloris asiatica]|uniref:Prefoldin subunit 1 n=1 Tax=Chrysochloris asiatica TaxID=185453 RepID=A0A9B0TNJ7_CHRAS|nr:PREDICTED: prefoldin subunit 1-like [Chrysochloris asiatica]